LDQARDAVDAVLERLRAVPGVHRAERAGEARRGTEVVADVLAAAVVDVDAVPAVLAALDAAPGPERDGVPTLVTSGDTPVTIGLGHYADTFGALWLWLTGAPEHVQAVAARANERGGTLGPLGLHLAERRVACPDEDDVYAALDLHPTPPERREAGVPLVPRGEAAPRLLRREDLRGALHNHTTSSDGISSLEEMCAAANAAGLEYLGISEHSQTAAYAGGLDAGALRAQIATIAALNATRAAAGGTTVLSGIESDILKEGDLDYPDDVLAGLDVVIASVHNRYGLGRDGMTARMLAAAANPWVDVIGHPTGRLILGRPASEFDVEAWLDACAASGCAVELNANPQRLDLCERHLAMAKERGLLVSISADAHSAQALAHLDYGVVIARRAGLGPADVLNAKPLAELRAWLAERRARAAPGGSRNTPSPTRS
ncbi:MAG: DNA polymerase/3'-5' exonuclease PolX, partial [Myxococcales bacterium]|nr:DNA polymerase/3'-5' exonuclease PolX [Myxococcales bacterium]